MTFRYFACGEQLKLLIVDENIDGNKSNEVKDAGDRSGEGEDAEDKSGKVKDTGDRRGQRRQSEGCRRKRVGRGRMQETRVGRGRMKGHEWQGKGYRKEEYRKSSCCFQ